jgi:hypothetical protein
MAVVHMGYLGSARINNNLYFVTGSSINPVHEFNAPELIQGRMTPYKYNWGKAEVGGNITGPLHEDAGDMWGLAYSRTDDMDHMLSGGSAGYVLYGEDLGFTIEISYYKSTGRQFDNCHVNSLELSISAGDVANFTMDFMGTARQGTVSSGISPIAVESLTDSTGSATPQKMITWSACSFVIEDSDLDIQAFSVNVSNNLQRAYKLGTDHFAPFDLIASLRRLTGSITVFASGPPGNNDAKDGYRYSDDLQGTTCSFAFGMPPTPIISLSNFKAQLKRSQAAARTDLSLYTIDYQVIGSDDLI